VCSAHSRPQIPPTLGEEDEPETIGSRDAQGMAALAGNPAFGQSQLPSDPQLYASLTSISLFSLLSFNFPQPPAFSDISSPFTTLLVLPITHLSNQCSSTRSRPPFRFDRSIIWIRRIPSYRYPIPSHCPQGSSTRSLCSRSRIPKGHFRTREEVRREVPSFVRAKEGARRRKGRT